jgi:5-formyltetrahydrofolate cyclo-ligase
MTGPLDTLKNQKVLLRKSAAKRRAELFDRDKGAAAKSLAGFADDFMPGAHGCVVSGYVPIGSEIDGMGLLGHLHERGFIIGLPLVTAPNTPLMFLNYRPGDRLVKGNFDVFTPEHDVATVTPELLLVPLLAFDRRGYRLGYGGGFYDRTLALLRRHGGIKAIGLAFSGQEVDAVPHDGFDQPLDGVLCENGLIEF